MIRTAALLFACALVTRQDGPASPALARFAPEQVDLAVFAPNMPGLLRNLEAPPYRRILHNESLQEAVAGLFGVRPLDAIKTLSLIIRNEAMLLVPRIDEPGFVLVFDTGLPIHPYAAVLSRLLGNEWKREEETIEGMRAARLVGPTSTVYVVGAKRYLAVSNGLGCLPEVLRRISTPRSAGSLAEAEWFRRCVAAIGQADLLILVPWSRVRERSGLLKLLPPGTAGVGVGFGAKSLRGKLHLREAEPGCLRDWFGEPGRFRLPPGTFQDADSIFWLRPCWDRIWDRLETFTDDTEVRFAWERLKASSGIDLKKGLIDSFGLEAAMVEGLDRGGSALAWVSLRKPIQARRAARSIYESMRGQFRIFTEAPEETVLGEERLYRIEKTGFAATGRGIFLGSFEAICSAWEATGSPELSWAAVARERLPENAVAVHLQSGRGWRRRLEHGGSWGSFLPSSAVGRPKALPFAEIWKERIKALSPAAAGVAASVAWLRPVEEGLGGELWIHWTGD